MKNSVPIFLVTDYEQALEFYLDKLGFTLGPESHNGIHVDETGKEVRVQLDPGPRVSGIVSRGDWTVLLEQVAAKPKEIGGRCVVRTNSIDELCRELCEIHGVKEPKQPLNLDWGAELIYVDPWGNVTRFEDSSDADLTVDDNYWSGMHVIRAEPIQDVEPPDLDPASWWKY